MLISSKKSLSEETSRILCDQISGFHGLAKLTHKIYIHAICMNHLKSLLNIDSWALSSDSDSNLLSFCWGMLM